MNNIANCPHNVKNNILEYFPIIFLYVLHFIDKYIQKLEEINNLAHTINRIEVFLNVMNIRFAL